jgi:hypothetical protein
VYGPRVRIAVFGPVGKSESQLDRALDFAFASLLVDRAVYLGDPELVRRRRSSSHVSIEKDPLWTRSLRCLDAEASEIERFVASERRKLDWARLELLGEAGSSSVVLSGRRQLFLCEDEALAHAQAGTARVVVRGPDGQHEHDGFASEQRGLGLWLCPGSLDHAGIVLVSDENELLVEVYDLRGRQLDRNVLEPS